eukprot:5746343-Amphidinium_carterae.1
MSLSRARQGADNAQKAADTIAGITNFANSRNMQQVQQQTQLLCYLAKTGRPLQETVDALDKVNKSLATTNKCFAVLGAAGAVCSIASGVMTMFLGDPNHAEIMNMLKMLSLQISEINQKLDGLPDIVREVVREAVAEGHVGNWLINAKTDVAHALQYAGSTWSGSDLDVIKYQVPRLCEEGCVPSSLAKAKGVLPCRCLQWESRGEHTDCWTGTDTGGPGASDPLPHFCCAASRYGGVLRLLL